MRLAITHLTDYRYDQPVPYALQELRMTPRSDGRQAVLSWHLGIEGGKVEAEFDDQHGNRVTLVSMEPGAEAIRIRSEGVVETTDFAGVMGPHGGYAPLWYFRRSTPLTKAGPLVRKLVRALGQETAGDVARLHALLESVARAVNYQTGHTDARTSAEDALDAGRGVCQYQGHVFISAARLMGFPARYASGYLMMEGGAEQDASHAWAEAYVDGLGWVGFDVANGISPDVRYVRMATGLDYSEAAPVSGMRLGDSGETMSITLHVEQ